MVGKVGGTLVEDVRRFQQTNVHTTHHLATADPGSGGLGRGLGKDEAAVTCTRDGKVRAVNLEVELILDMTKSVSASR